MSTVSNPSHQQMVHYLRRANQIAIQARSHNHHPFGALLVAPDHQTILLEQGNVDPVNHAEAVLARSAFAQFSTDYLWSCTLYTTAEPCAMCAGTQYWANIGRLAYGIAETRLLELTGNNPENPTLKVPCRYIFDHGQKPIQVWGPFAEVEAEIVAVHKDFWDSHRL
jgi:tRNA(Arg) A34 adenosine deaminase TadA